MSTIEQIISWLTSLSNCMPRSLVVHPYGLIETVFYPRFFLEIPQQTITVLYHSLAAAESLAVGLVQHLGREVDQTLAEVRSLEVELQLEESLAVGED